MVDNKHASELEKQIMGWVRTLMVLSQLLGALIHLTATRRIVLLEPIDS